MRWIGAAERGAPESVLIGGDPEALAPCRSGSQRPQLAEVGEWGKSPTKGAIAHRALCPFSHRRS